MIRKSGKINGPLQLVFHYFWNYWKSHKVFLNDCAGLSVNGWLYRGPMILSEISVVVQLSNKIGYAMLIESLRKGMMKSL